MLIKNDKQDKFLGERKQIISGYWKPDSMSSTLVIKNRISKANETKLLKVIIGKKLNWSPHIICIGKMIAKDFGIKARQILNDKYIILLVLYTSLSVLK